MKQSDFLSTLSSPLPNATLKAYPQGHILQGWGESPDLYTQSFGYLSAHSGLDITTFHGDNVCAAHDGVVTFAGGNRTDIGGLTVKLSSMPLDFQATADGRITSFYIHLDTMRVTEGQQVTKGTVLGTEGNSGFVISGSTKYWGNAPAGIGTHLHFGIHEEKANTVNGAVSWNDRYLNAMQNTTDPLPLLLHLPYEPLHYKWSFNKDLSSGMNGTDVIALQTALQYLGFFNSQSITGFYGAVTEKAVQAFQLSKGIVVGGTPSATGFGRCGPKTRAILNTITN